MTIFRTTLLSALLSFAFSQTSLATQKETTKAANKTEAKKKKAITKTKPAEAQSKVKADKKGVGKTETKQKAKPKSTVAKKPAKEQKKLATADTFEKEDSGFLFFAMFVAIASLAFICTVCFAIWLDYRPTVYPSGKVYGAMEYLQGPFTTEINGVQKQKTMPNGSLNTAQVAKPTETASKVNQPAPVTVTREPVNKSVKHPSAKAG